MRSKDKGVYKHTWYKNLLVLDAREMFISLFNKEDIPAILLKGVPLLGMYMRIREHALLATLI